MDSLNKKSQSDTMVIPIIMFIGTLAVVVFYYVLLQFSTLPILSQYPEANETIQRGLALFSGMDFAMPGILFALNIFSLLGLFFLQSSPILMIASIIGIPLTIWISAAMSNAFESSIQTMGLAANFPIMVLVMAKLPLIEFVFDILGGILLYAIIYKR